MHETKKKVDISIVTVSFNSVKTIEQTIASVVHQTYNNIEYIIIDGASTDGTVEIIKKYKEGISSWISEKDEGIYDAMNKGIALAKGDYIYFLGADDFFVDADIVKKLAEEIMKDLEIDVLSAPVWLVDGKFNLQMTYTNEFTLEDIYAGYSIPHQGFFVRTTYMKEHLFDSSFKIAADYNLFLTLYFNPNINFKFIKEKVAFFSLDGISSRKISLRTEECVRIMKQHNILDEFVKKYKSQNGQYYIIRRWVKDRLKELFSAIGLLDKFQMNRGWIPHSCKWRFCRWCNK